MKTALLIAVCIPALLTGCNKHATVQTAAATNQPPPAPDTGPPQIVATSPQAGDTDVDPALTEITVTFDQDMAGGFSWTGGGPDYPQSPPGQSPQWRDKRTCVLPVTLRPGHSYRVGINSPSFQNFRSASGIPVEPSAIYFTTRGAGQSAAPLTGKPRIVGLTPKNRATDVDPNLTEIRVTFNEPMGEGFSWTGSGPEFPPSPEGKHPYWTDDHKTCALPVQLQPGHTYSLGLNSPSHRNFQSADGIPLDPIRFSFTTRPN